MASAQPGFEACDILRPFSDWSTESQMESTDKWVDGAHFVRESGSGHTWSCDGPPESGVGAIWVCADGKQCLTRLGGCAQFTT